jgi:hypothetical protein
VLLGAKPVRGLDASVIGFRTNANDVVLLFKNEDSLEGRNANVDVTGLEAQLSYDWSALPLSLYGNGTVILESTVRPQRKPDETDYTWKFSQFNTSFPSDRYPKYMANLGASVGPIAKHLVASFDVRLVGKRRASTVNSQLYNPFNLQSSYDLGGYAAFDITVSTVGLRLFSWLGNRETIFSVSARNLTTYHGEPGVGGIDVGSLGPSFYLRMGQQL